MSALSAAGGAGRPRLARRGEAPARGSCGPPASLAPGGAPRGPGGERSHLTRRHGACSGPPGASGARAFPPEPRRGCPRAASPAPSTNQRGRRALRTRGLSAPRRPGDRRPPRRAPGGRPGMLLRAGSPAVWTPLPEDGRSHRNSAGLGSSIPPESRSRALHRWLL